METSVIIALITAVSGVLGYLFKYLNDKNSDKQKEIKQKQIDELKKKIEETEIAIIQKLETSITDVPSLRLKLEEYRKQLKSLIPLILVISCLFVGGCAFFNRDQPVIVGERIFYMSPGQQMTVPELKSPAKQWYLIDDVAMLKVLGIDKPVDKITTTLEPPNQ